MFLKEQIATLEKMIDHLELSATRVSAKGIDWHVDHMLKVIIKVSNALKNSNPLVYRRKYNLLRSVIFVSGKIPRGKGRAPKSVQPPEVILKEDLFQQIKEARKHINEMKDLPANSNFKHPYFGVLNLKMAQRFLDIHTNHHLKIIREILQSK